jgi:hypothetical protein
MESFFPVVEVHPGNQFAHPRMRLRLGSLLIPLQISYIIRRFPLKGGF